MSLISKPIMIQMLVMVWRILLMMLTSGMIIDAVMNQEEK